MDTDANVVILNAREIVSTGQLVANIPFVFSAGNQTLPAGEYFVRCVNPEVGVPGGF